MTSSVRIDYSGKENNSGERLYWLTVDKVAYPEAMTMKEISDKLGENENEEEKE